MLHSILFLSDAFETNMTSFSETKVVDSMMLLSLSSFQILHFHFYCIDKYATYFTIMVLHTQGTDRKVSKLSCVESKKQLFSWPYSISNFIAVIESISFAMVSSEDSVSNPSMKSDTMKALYIVADLFRVRRWRFSLLCFYEIHKNYC